MYQPEQGFRKTGKFFQSLNKRFLAWALALTLALLAVLLLLPNYGPMALPAERRLIDFVFWVFRWFCYYLVVAGAFFVLVACLYSGYGKLLQGNARRARVIAVARFILFTTFAAIVLQLLIELPNKDWEGFGLWLADPFSNDIIVSTGFLFFLYAFVLFLTNGAIASTVLGSAVIILTTINYNKTLLRFEPIALWDVTFASTAAGVLEQTHIELPECFGMMLAIFTFFVVLSMPVKISKKWLHAFPRKKSSGQPLLPFKKTGVFFRSVGALSLLALLFIYTDNYYLSGPKIKAFVTWDAASYVEEAGLLNYFLPTARMYSMGQQPSGYSRQAVLEIVDEAKEIASGYTGQINPNVILVMGESFWDIEKQMPNIDIQEEIFPNLNRARRQGMSGELLVNVFGGGTVYSEFSVFTGFHQPLYIQPPYPTLVHKPYFSAASYLKAEGYTTIVTHSLSSRYYHRNTAYPYMGFDNIYFMWDTVEVSTLVVNQEDLYRGYIPDTRLWEYTEEKIAVLMEETGAPIFASCLTVHNHPGYSWQKYPRPEDAVQFEAPGFSERGLDELADVIPSLRKTDEAIGLMMDFVDKQTEPTLLVFYGDHISPVGEGEELFLAGGAYTGDSSETIKNTANYTTPYIAYTNFDKTKVETELTSIANLLPMVFSNYDVKRPLYFDLINESIAVLPVCNDYGYYTDDEGKPVSLTPEQQMMYDKIALIQYDYVYGKKYGIELFE